MVVELGTREPAQALVCIGMFQRCFFHFKQEYDFISRIAMENRTAKPRTSSLQHIQEPLFQAKLLQTCF